MFFKLLEKNDCYSELVNWITVNKRKPNYYSTDKTERRLAKWLEKEINKLGK